MKKKAALVFALVMIAALGALALPTKVLSSTAQLIFGTIADGQLLMRSGGRIVGTSAVGNAQSQATLTYASSVAIDFDPLLPQTKKITLTGVLTLTTSHLAAGRRVDVHLVCDSADRALTLPVGWTALGATPLICPASKIVRLSLLSTTTADTGVVYTVDESTRAEMDSPAYAASVAIDFARSTAPLTKVGTLTGNITLTTSGLVAGRIERVLLTSDGSSRNLTLPAGWTCLGTAPTALAAGKSGLFTLISTTTADSGVFYTYDVVP